MKVKDLNLYNIEPKKGVDNEYPVLSNEFRQPCLWYIASPRFTGKTYMVSKFIATAQTKRKHKTYDRIYIITPSFKSNEAYFADYINLEDVYEPTRDSIDKVLAAVEADKDEWEQFLADKETYKEFKKQMRDKGNMANVKDDIMLRFDTLGFLEGKQPRWKYEVEEPPKSLVVMDDILGSKAISGSSNLMKIATLNRHISPLQQDHTSRGKTRSACGLAVIILSQSYRLVGGISRTLRENLSLFTVFLNRQPKQMEAITEEIGSSVEEAKFTAAYNFAVSTPFGSLTTDLKPICERNRFRKNLNKAIIFGDEICNCEACKNRKK